MVTKFHLSCVCMWLDGVFLLSVFCCPLCVFSSFVRLFFCEFLCGV